MIGTAPQSRNQWWWKPLRRRGLVSPTLPSVVSSTCCGTAAEMRTAPRKELRAPTRCRDMTGQSDDKTTSRRKPKARKFYIISYTVIEKLPDFEITNLNLLLAGKRVLAPPVGQRGFPRYSENPRVLIGAKRGRPLRDLELFHAYWLISDRLKSLFESFDPAAFAFQTCDVQLCDGSAGPAYWLCDIVRIIDPFGERTLQEIRRYRERTGERYCSFIGNKDLIFKEDAVGNTHIFRTPYSWADVFCDQSLKDACRNSGMKGVQFRATFS